MAIGNGGNSCAGVFPNTRAWVQQDWNDRETDEEGKKRGVSSMERSKMATKERSPDGLSLPIQNTVKT